MKTDSIEQFLYKHRIRAKRSYMRIPRPVSFNYNDVKQDYYNAYMHVEEVPSVELSISEEDFKSIIERVEQSEELERHWGPNAHQVLNEAFRVTSEQSHESRIRQSNPAVKIAWEKYQMLLKIAGG